MSEISALTSILTCPCSLFTSWDVIISAPLVCFVSPLLFLRSALVPVTGLFPCVFRDVSVTPTLARHVRERRGSPRVRDSATAHCEAAPDKGPLCPLQSRSGVSRRRHHRSAQGKRTIAKTCRREHRLQLCSTDRQACVRNQSRTTEQRQRKVRPAGESAGWDQDIPYSLVQGTRSETCATGRRSPLPAAGLVSSEETQRMQRLTQPIWYLQETGNAFGWKTKVCLLAAFGKGMCATMRCMSSGCIGLVTRSFFFLQDWELAQVALSCHMALDRPCQELNGRW